MMRFLYVSGDNIKGDILFSDLIESLKGYEKEAGKNDSTS